ncbi:MAG: DNA polymerase Y family protein [Polyangiaceae bacterium]|jgi:protein ImuB|nr:DNA polymerase Y family protein [Polyangiaceae bacterium]
MTLPRRIAAIVLPHFLCELATPIAQGQRARHRPSAVALVQHAAQLREQDKLDAVDEQARRLGLREGLTIAEARAFVASLEVHPVLQRQVDEGLARVAELALAFSPKVALAPPDAVVLDLTGAAHLHGGEHETADALLACIEGAGHLARVAVAGGPRLAQAIARHAARPVSIVAPGDDARCVAALPVTALPIDADLGCWLTRVGVLTIGDLARLPRDQVASRLGPRAPEVLGMAAGMDPAPLTLYEPPPVIREEASWDEGLERQEGLLFVLNRLTARLAARLQGRGQALHALLLAIQHDPAIARLRSVPPAQELRMELPAPIYRCEDLLGTLRTRLERTQLQAPAIGVVLEAQHVVPAPRIQLDISRDVTASPDALPVLLAELAADIGAERVGTLTLVDTHRPEARSVLRPITRLDASAAGLAPHGALGASVTRLLASPVLLGRGKPRRGAVVTVGSSPACEVVRVDFESRLQAAEWWTASPLHRDYLEVWLRLGACESCAWVYLDRKNKELRLHGWMT